MKGYWSPVGTKLAPNLATQTNKLKWPYRKGKCSSWIFQLMGWYKKFGASRLVEYVPSNCLCGMFGFHGRCCFGPQWLCVYSSEQEVVQDCIMWLEREFTAEEFCRLYVSADLYDLQTGPWYPRCSSVIPSPIMLHSNECVFPISTLGILGLLSPPLLYYVHSRNWPHPCASVLHSKSEHNFPRILYFGLGISCL